MKEKILELLAEKKYNALFELLLETNTVDIALVMSELENHYMIRVFRLLSKDEAAEVFSYLEPDDQVRLVSLFSDRELSKVIEEMYLDDTVDLISEMPATIVRRILSTSTPEQRKLINEFLKYPEDSAGALMTNEFVDFKSFSTVKECIEKVRNVGVDKETIYTSYVLDEKRKLIGILDLKDLLLADYDISVSEIMETSFIFAGTNEDKEDVAKKFSKYDLIALPVVDSESRLVGIITVDDAIDVIIEETAEDFEKMNAITPDDVPYFKISVFKHAKNRIIWLLVLMFSSVFTALIINHYESAFTALPILVSFIPLLMSCGGNSGAQTSTMIIRGMATDEIHLSDFFRAVFKEFRIGLICSTALAAVNFIRVMVQYNDVRIALVTSLSMIGTMVTAVVMACILPMLAKKLKTDPALMASPLITTIVDITTVFIYFNVAIAIFGKTLIH